MRLLLVEDDVEMLGVLQRGFDEERYDVVCARTGREALAHLAAEGFDALVLDVMLPGGLDGLEVCRRLRTRREGLPVLMLTARDAVEDRVAGLDAGADDYLVKPFAFRELLARIRALLRRPPAPAGDVIRIADLQVDLRRRSVTRHGSPISLTTREFALLSLLARRAGDIVDRADITAHVWDENHDPFANALEVLVCRLRAKIDNGFGPHLLHTVRGVGYRLGT